MRAVALLTIVALLAGCGTVTAHTGTLTGATTVPGTGAAAPAGPAAGNRAEALAYGRQLLAGLKLSPGTTPVHVSSVPEPLRDAWHPSAGSADLGQVFLARQPMTTVFAFLRAHLPSDAGMVAIGQQNGSGADAAYYVDYFPHDLPAGLESANVDLAVGPAGSGTTLVTAYVHVTWFLARSAAERFSSVKYDRVVVTATVFNPTFHHVTRTTTAATFIARLIGYLNSLHAAPDVTISCPAELVTYRLTLMSGHVPRVVIEADGCFFVGVTVGGSAQPALWDQGNTVAAMAARLLPPLPPPL